MAPHVVISRMFVPARSCLMARSAVLTALAKSSRASTVRVVAGSQKRARCSPKVIRACSSRANSAARFFAMSARRARSIFGLPKTLASRASTSSEYGGPEIAALLQFLHHERSFLHRVDQNVGAGFGEFVGAALKRGDRPPGWGSRFEPRVTRLVGSTPRRGHAAMFVSRCARSPSRKPPSRR